MTIIVQTTASASARDYDWLKSAIAKWSGNRSDLDSLIPDFVMMAEKRINADLDARKQEIAATITIPPGAVSVALPSDVGAIRSLSRVGCGELEYLTNAMFNEQGWQATSGQPECFTLIGRTLYPGPLPDAAYSLQIAYRQKVPALADSAGTNWLIEQHPDLYLAASMVESITYTKNVADLPMWEGRYQAAITGLNDDDDLLPSLVVRSDVRTV